MRRFIPGFLSIPPNLMEPHLQQPRLERRTLIIAGDSSGIFHVLIPPRIMATFQDVNTYYTRSCYRRPPVSSKTVSNYPLAWRSWARGLFHSCSTITNDAVVIIDVSVYVNWKRTQTLT